MKISTGLIFRRAVDQMGSAQGKLAQMQAQLSSGRAVVKASDAPEQATAIQRLKSVIARQDGFEQNLQTTENRLGLEEAVLSSATTILARVKELAIQAANDSNSPTDRQILAIEIDELRGELLAAGNSKDVNGNYIFAGSRVKKPAFYTDPRGDVVYQGDQTRNLVDVTPKWVRGFKGSPFKVKPSWLTIIPLLSGAIAPNWSFAETGSLVSKR